MKSQATVFFSEHRPEVVPLAATAMERHAAIFLEEPADPGFFPMLEGNLPVETYIMGLDVEYPRFTRDMCGILQGLHRRGKAIFQVEPYLEDLLRIHDLFADGGAPSDLVPGTPIFDVYEAERRATAALIAFYGASVTGEFAAIVATVKRFARLDAARFRLRDFRRAEALAERLSSFPSAYIEAGIIHYPLWRTLKSMVGERVRITPRFLLKAATRAMGGRGTLYPPGDLLTLHYLFHPGVRDEKEDTLAARALIYNKLIQKEEIPAAPRDFPHTRDQLAVTRAVNLVSTTACRALFQTMGRAKTADARAIFNRFLEEESIPAPALPL